MPELTSNFQGDSAVNAQNSLAKINSKGVTFKVGVCESTKEELKSDYPGLRLGDVCRVCNCKVGFHASEFPSPVTRRTRSDSRSSEFPMQHSFSQDSSISAATTIDPDSRGPSLSKEPLQSASDKNAGNSTVLSWMSLLDLSSKGSTSQKFSHQYQNRRDQERDITRSVDSCVTGTGSVSSFSFSFSGSNQSDTVSLHGNSIGNSSPQKLDLSASLYACNPDAFAAAQQLGDKYMSQGRFEKAEALFVAYRGACVRVHGGEHPDSLAASVKLAELYRLRGNFDEAQALLDAQLSWAEQTYGESSEEVASVIHRLGTLALSRKQYEIAEESFRRCLSWRMAALGAAHKETIATQAELAAALEKRGPGRYAEAEELLEQCLASVEQTVEPNDDKKSEIEEVSNLPSTRVSKQRLQSQLCRIRARLGRTDEAESILVTDLVQCKTSKGPTHVDTVAASANLSYFYCTQRRWVEAEPLVMTAAKESKRQLGDAHPDTLQAMEHLAFVSDKLGKVDRAEVLYTNLLSIRTQLLSGDHPDTLLVLGRLATLLRDQRKFDKAEPLYLRALEVNVRIFGEYHKDTARTLMGLAQLYDKQDEYDHATAVYTRCLTVCREIAVMGPDHPHTWEVTDALAKLHYAQACYSDAEALFTTTLESRERVLGHEHLDTIKSCESLAQVFDSCSKYDKAEPLYIRCMEVRKALLGPSSEETLSCILSLAMMYESSAQYQEAESLYLSWMETHRQSFGEEDQRTKKALSAVTRYFEGVKAREKQQELEDRNRGSLFNRASNLSSRSLGSIGSRQSSFKGRPSSLRTSQSFNSKAISTSYQSTEDANDLPSRIDSVSVIRSRSRSSKSLKIMPDDTKLAIVDNSCNEAQSPNPSSPICVLIEIPLDEGPSTSRRIHTSAPWTVTSEAVEVGCGAGCIIA